MRRGSLARQHLPLNISEPDVQAINRPTGTASRRCHQNRQQLSMISAYHLLLPESIRPIPSALPQRRSAVCRHTSHLVYQRTNTFARQAATHTIIKSRGEARFWSMNDGNNHRGVVIVHHGSHLDSRDLSRSSLRCLHLSITPSPTTPHDISPQPHFLLARWDDVWYCRNLRLAIREDLRLLRCAGGRSGTFWGDVAKRVKLDLKRAFTLLLRQSNG